LPDSPLQLIVGLGNPGPKYSSTRHNAGFWLVDCLVRKYGGSLRAESRFKGDACRISIAGQSIWLLKPMNFMNRSGASIAALARFYKIPLPAILVAHDELDLPVGVVRLKRGGGPGGHNGVRDSIKHLGGNDFIRLRLGVGHPGNSRDVMDYVLRKAPQSEQRLLEDAVDDSIREIDRIVTGQLEKAMTVLHSRKIAIDT